MSGTAPPMGIAGGARGLLGGVFGHPLARVGVVLLAAIALGALVGAAFLDPSTPVARPQTEPSWAHWLGTTGQGQDVFAQLVVATRNSLASGLLVGVLVVAIGAAVGVTAGYFGGWVDEGLSLLVNVLLVVPSLPLAIVVAVYLPSGFGAVLFVLVLTGWAWNARVVRAETLSVARRDFVAAAVVSGEGHARVLFAEILPNLGAILASQVVTSTTYAVGAQVGLEFLGLGDVGAVTWGTMLYWATNDQALLTRAWWTFVPTGLTIAAVGLALTTIGYAVDELANPRLGVERRFRVALGREGIPSGRDTPVALDAGRAT